MTRRKPSNLLPRCLLKKSQHNHGGDASYEFEETQQSPAKTDDEYMSMDDKKESMGDNNCHNSNRVEAGGAQGGNFVDS